MPDRLQTFPVQFQGGLITNLPTLQHGLQAPGSARLLVNLEPSISGGYKKIGGFDKFDANEVTGTGLIRGVHEYQTEVFAARNTHLYKSSGSGWTQVTDNATFSSTGITLGGTGKVRFAKIKFGATKKLVVFDDTNKPLVFDGTTLSRLTGAPTEVDGATLGVEYKNHLFIAEDNFLVFTAPFDETDFTPASGAGTITLEDRITSLNIFRDQLVIFTKRSIKVLTGSSLSDFQVQPITDDLGCVEFDTALEFGGDVMFLGPDGLRLLSGTDRNNDFGLGVVSKVIQDEVQEFLRFSSSFHAMVMRDKSQYRIFGFNSNFTNDSTRGIIATQFAQQGGTPISWAETRGINAYVAYSEYVDDEEVFYFANADGYVYELETANDFDGEAVPFSFATPFLPISDPVTRKTVHSVDVYLDPEGSYAFSLSLKYDFDNFGTIQPPPVDIESSILGASFYGSATYGSGNFGGTIRYVVEAKVTGSGDVVSLLFEGESSDPPFAFDSVVIQYGQYGRR